MLSNQGQENQRTARTPRLQSGLVNDSTPDPAVSQVEAGLASELLKIHCDSYGKGAAQTRVHYFDDTIICFMDDLELLPSERFLIESGEGDAVTEVRSRYQASIEATYRAAVERITGRRVVQFVSATRLSPDWAVEIFRLAPRAPDKLVEGQVDG